MAIGASFGGAICPLKLLPIGRPGIETKQPELQAERCDSYGKKTVGFNVSATSAPIMIPVGLPTTLVTEPDDPNMNSCYSCSNFIEPRKTAEQTGWTSGYCSATGSLVLPDRAHLYPSKCGQYKDGYSPPAAGQIRILPELTEGFGKPDPLALFRKISSGDFNPATYKGDKEASPKAMQLGVRSWLRVEDMKGNGPAVYLPMFDDTKFSKDEEAKIPRTGDDEHPELYIDHDGYVYRVAVMWTKLGETPALWGEPGTGKTELFRHMAWLMTLPFERVSITGSSELDDIAGKMMYTPEVGTYFHYGRVPQAWRKPNVLCLDEPNVGPPDVWQFFRPLTDNSKQLVLDQNKGEAIPAHAACYLGMAMNPAWDPRNIGAMQLGDADGSRLLHIRMELPPRDVERTILVRRLALDKVPEDEALEIANTVLNIADDIRQLSRDGVIPCSWGIRNQIKVARVKRYMSWTDAYRTAVVDSLEPEAGQAILDVVRSKVE